MVKTIKRILVVDEEAEFINTISRHLKRVGYIMDSADGVEEARKKIDESVRREIPYDLVIMDVVMPNMGAIALLSSIKKNYPGISVIVTSGFGDIDTLRETMRPDLNGYAKKPLIPQEMTSLINRLDQNRRKS